MQLYIFKYDDDEWDNVLVKDPAWTRGETDYLLELCELFDLRFLIIADRYAVGHLYWLPLSAATLNQPPSNTYAPEAAQLYSCFVSWLLICERALPVQYPGGVHRSMEDIKARYYAVARQLLVGREGTEDSVANNVLVKHPFNLTHERYCCFIVVLITHERFCCRTQSVLQSRVTWQ